MTGRSEQSTPAIGPRFLLGRRHPWLLVLLGIACASRNSADQEPLAIHAQSLGAQREARALEANFANGSDPDRAALEPLIVGFLSRYPEDPQAHRIRLRLAWLRIQQHRWPEAEQLANEVASTESGNVADGATLVRAAIANRRGRSREALGLLRPLAGRLIDENERDLWALESVQASLTERRYAEAIDWMTAWRVDASDEHVALVESQIARRLAAVPHGVLERALSRLTQATSLATLSAARARGRERMVELVRERLAEDALHRQDPQLARRLLDIAPPRFSRPETGAQLSQLALSEPLNTHLAAPVLGIVLEIDTPLLRRRTTEFVAGVVQTLDALGAASTIRIATRTAAPIDSGEYRHVLDELIQEGAVVVVSGLSSAWVRGAVDWFVTQQLALLSLDPVEPVKLENAFRMGIERDPIQRAWQSGVADARPDGILDGEHPFCSSSGTDSVSAPPAAATRRPTLVLDDPQCSATKAWHQTTRTNLPALWLGPEAASMLPLIPNRVPVGLITSLPLSQEPPPESLALWQRRLGRQPTWYEALGHDAAVLVAQALGPLPEEPVTGEIQVRRVRTEVAARLRAARGELWTTERNGFEGGDRIQRQWVVMTPASTKARRGQGLP